MDSQPPLQSVGIDRKTKRDLFASVVQHLNVPPNDFEAPHAHAFALLLVSPRASDEISQRTARTWIERGAVFVLCVGPAAEQLEQTFDDATFLPEFGAELAHAVMTTAHTNEALESVLDFAFEHANCAEGAPAPLESVILLTTSASIFEATAQWLNSRQSLTS